MNREYLAEAEAFIQIPFHDVDVMGVVWHGHYLKYFEIARCNLLDKIGYNYREMQNSQYAWPVIDLQLRFLKPVFYEDNIRVAAGLLEYENRLKINYTIEKRESGELLTKGYTVQVAFNMASKEMELVSPEVLRNKIEALL